MHLCPYRTFPAILGSLQLMSVFLNLLSKLERTMSDIGPVQRDSRLLGAVQRSLRGLRKDRRWISNLSGECC
jgi:hypothetical protein